MIVYNFAAEYAALVIIIAILLSFSRDYDAKTLEYRFLKFTYVISFVTVLITIAALISGVPGTGTVHLTVARVTNILYFIFIPSISLCYLIYSILVTTIKFDEHEYHKKLIPAVIPYLIYLIVLITGLVAGKVFHVTETEGYVRGDWFQLPYWIVVFNLVSVVIVVFRNIKSLHRDIIKVMITTAVLACVLLFAQYLQPNTILTGILNTSCILGIHLYAQNVKKATDQLTGVYNRMSLVHILEQYVDKKEDCSLYVFSLRGMKVINERNGIAYGDKVLMRTAQIFLIHAADNVVFRYGGDEFALLLDHKQKNHDGIISSIVANLDTKQTIDGNDFTVEFVYTRVDYDLFGRNVRELISAIDYSISSLKNLSNQDRYLYDTAVVKTLIRRNDMVQQLKDALETNMFEVHYQPIYCKETGLFTQAEALVRMRNTEGYLVYPGDFIDLAVKTGLIVQMTYLILERVCSDLRYLIDSYGEGFTLESISVNFPYLQFTDENMPKKVMDILNKHNIQTSMIKIEITEREMVADTARTRDIMLEMREQGFGFELDDFGMDYSNVSVVLDLPLETVKLDRSLLLAAFEKSGNMTFFRHLVMGIAGIGASIICEGVEEREQLDFVLSCGCQYAQGYLFSKPLAREALRSFLKKNTPAVIPD